MSKIWRKYSLLFALLLIGQASFADFGIPLWVTNAPTLLACFSYGGSVVGDITGFFILFAIVSILLLFVTLIEAFVAKFILKNTKFSRLFRIFYLANLVSTLIGAIVVSVPMFINYKFTMPLLILGPWAKLLWIPSGLAIILMNVTLLIISYFIEYNVGKKWLKQDYEIKKIKKAFIIANIVTYSLSILLYVPLTWWEMSDYWQKANYNLKNDMGNMPNINDIEFVLPITRPEPLSYEDCKSELKNLGVDNSSCSKETNRNYWAGAVKMCGGVDYMLSKEQTEELIQKIYRKEYYLNIDNVLEYEKTKNKEYNLKRLKKEWQTDDISIHYYPDTNEVVWKDAKGEQIKRKYNNKEFLTFGYKDVFDVLPRYVYFWSKTKEIERFDLDEKDVFALCTKEKNASKKTKFTFKDYWNEYKKYVKDKDYQFYEKGRHYYTEDELNNF